MIDSVINFVKEYPFCSVAIAAAVVCYVQRCVVNYYWFTVPMLVLAAVFPMILGTLGFVYLLTLFLDKGWLPT